MALFSLRSSTRVVSLPNRHSRSSTVQVYANSVWGDAPPFQSVFSVVDESHRSAVHTIYGFSKDFGIAGARVGVLHSTNSDILQAVSSLLHFCEASRS